MVCLDGRHGNGQVRGGNRDALPDRTDVEDAKEREQKEDPSHWNEASGQASDGGKEMAGGNYHQTDFYHPFGGSGLTKQVRQECRG